MKIALVGSGGYIAGFLLEKFAKEKLNILKIDQSEEADAYLNLEKAEEFNYDVLKEIEYIVFTAAISGPDKCASEFDWCWKINVTGTKIFIENAIRKGCKVLFFSSDAVFGDIPGIIYTEKSETKAQTPYGCMKKAIEDQFKSEPNFKVIRLSYVVSIKDKFMSYCMKCIDRNETADVFHPFYRNCIVVSDVVDVVMWMIVHWSEYKPFVLNVAGKELVSRVRMVDEINRFLGNKLKYRISAPGESFYRNRPPITQMRSLYMEEYGILKSDTFTEKIEREIKTYI